MQPRQTADRLLNWKRDLPFNLLRGKRRRYRIDLNLNGSSVGKRVDVKLLGRERADNSEQPRRQDHQRAMA